MFDTPADHPIHRPPPGAGSPKRSRTYALCGQRGIGNRLSCATSHRNRNSGQPSNRSLTPHSSSIHSSNRSTTCGSTCAASRTGGSGGHSRSSIRSSYRSRWSNRSSEQRCNHSSGRPSSSIRNRSSSHSRSSIRSTNRSKTCGSICAASRTDGTCDRSSYRSTSRSKNRSSLVRHSSSSRHNMTIHIHNHHRDGTPWHRRHPS